MTEADQNKRILNEAIGSLEQSENMLNNLQQSLTEVGADLNTTHSHVTQAMRQAIAALSNLRDGTATASMVMGGTSGYGPEAIGFLQRADTDLQDLVKALNLVKGWIEDARSGPHRTSTEERPRIVQKVNGAITRLRSYMHTL